MKIFKKLFYSFILSAIFIIPILSGCGDNSNSDAITVNGIKYVKLERSAGECYFVYGCSSDIEILNIPSEIEGLPVLGFNRNAFANNTMLKEVVIPDTIKSISMDLTPFKGCVNIEKLTLATCDVEYLFNEYGSGVESNTEPLPKSLKYIYLTSACTKIKTRSFRYCNYLREIYIPASVTEIDDGTNNINIGVNGNTSNKNKFNSLPFLGCTNLTIYCEAKSKPEKWGTYWNYISSTTQAHVVWDRNF